MSESMSIGVIGGGAWGTALAHVTARKMHSPVPLWAREADVVASINGNHENRLFLPGIGLDGAVQATGALADMGSSDILLVAVPAQFMRAICTGLKAHLHPLATLVICAKGIEQQSAKLMSEVVADVLPGQSVAILSGPTFAHEVAKGLPTAITLACADEGLGKTLAETLGQPTFRPYWSPDVIGAEVGGAVKNVLAIACGIAEGCKLGENAKASIITRGFAELLRLGTAKGADPLTLMGLCGLGDLILTCGSRQSRNMSLGVALGEGVPAPTALSGKRTVAEGAYTAPVLAKMAAELGIDMPICQAVNQILSGAGVRLTISQLLSRPYKSETG